jgi:hypothetical protein
MRRGSLSQSRQPDARTGRRLSPDRRRRRRPPGWHPPRTRTCDHGRLLVVVARRRADVTRHWTGLVLMSLNVVTRTGLSARATPWSCGCLACVSCPCAAGLHGLRHGHGRTAVAARRTPDRIHAKRGRQPAPAFSRALVARRWGRRRRSSPGIEEWTVQAALVLQCVDE